MTRFGPSPTEVREPRPLRPRKVPFKWNPGTSKKKFRGLTALLKLYHSLPYWKRREVKIPPWYYEEFGVPIWLLRKKPSALKYSTRCRATLARLHYLYNFEIAPAYEAVPLGTHQRILAAKCDGTYLLLQKVLHAKYWHAPALKLAENLKVLLTPSTGWRN